MMPAAMVVVSAMAVEAGAAAFFHGDAGPVAHMLVRAGQGVEKRGFAAIGVASQRDTD
jgi:hypothetical protein